MYKFLLISVLFTLFPFNHIRGQIYVYHTSDTECKYPYEYILFAGDRILGIVRNFNETDANILGYYRDIYDSSNPMICRHITIGIQVEHKRENIH